MQAAVNRKLSNSAAISFIPQFPGIFFFILYWIFISDSSYYTENCIDLLEWSKAVLYLSATGIILSGTSLPLMYLAIFLFKSVVFFNALAYFLIGFTLIYMIALVTIFAGICSSFGEDEDCGDLRTLNFFFILIYSLVITLSLIWGLIVCVCTYRHRKKKKKQNKGDNYNQFTDEKNKGDDNNDLR